MVLIFVDTAYVSIPTMLYKLQTSDYSFRERYHLIKHVHLHPFVDKIKNNFYRLLQT
jgi:hypothetical protein